MKPHGAVGGSAKLVLESVGTADAAALRAIRQLVPGGVQEVARLVYQAPSELTCGLHDEAAVEIQTLLSGLGFRVSVATPEDDIHAGVGEFEIALVVREMNGLPAVIAEAAAFLGTDLTTARRLVCHSPAVLVSNGSAATGAAVRARFDRVGADVDVSRSSAARYFAVVPVENPGVRRVAADAIRGVAAGAPITETDAALLAQDLSYGDAQALWERLRRTGVRASICNRDLVRYDVSLHQAPDTDAVRELLASVGVPARVVTRLLQHLPVVVAQNVDHVTMQALLDRAAAVGGRATGLPHAFQRFGLILRSVKDQAAAVSALVTLGDLPEAAAKAAVSDRHGATVGQFTRTTALWLQHILAVQGAETEIDLR
jgi:ribosomal protein L7/L12